MRPPTSGGGQTASLSCQNRFTDNSLLFTVPKIRIRRFWGEFCNFDVKFKKFAVIFAVFDLGAFNRLGPMFVARHHVYAFLCLPVAKIPECTSTIRSSLFPLLLVVEELALCG